MLCCILHSLSAGGDVSSGRFFDVRYETLARDPLAMAERLSKWAGLDWNPKIGGLF